MSTEYMGRFVPHVEVESSLPNSMLGFLNIFESALEDSSTD